MARDTITPRQRAGGARRVALLGFAAALLVVATPASPAAAMLVDPVAVSAQACTMTGDGGADSLGGTAGRDVVCGLGGADRIRGQGGHDVLLGGAGGDLLQGKTGSDRLDGGPGNDRAFGGAGADDMRGGSGNDVLGGGLGPDRMSGGSGRDIVVYGQRGAAVFVTIGAGANDGVARERDNVMADVEDVQGGRGNDVLTGNGRSNRLTGGGGKDRLLGKGGSDVLIGGDSDDRIDAREGATGAGSAAQAGSVDRVVCGGGNDTALVDPVDIVDPGCENVIGGGGSTPPPSGGQPPAGSQPPGGTQPPPGPQNNPPTAVDDGASVGEDSAAGAIDVLANDTDGDGGAMAIASASDPANGAVVLTGGSPGAHTGLTYEPDPDYCNDPPGTAPETFTYTLNGGSTRPPCRSQSPAPPTCRRRSTTPSRCPRTRTRPRWPCSPTTATSTATRRRSPRPPIRPTATVVLTGGLPGAHTGLTYQPDPGYCNDPPGTTPDTFTYDAQRRRDGHRLGHRHVRRRRADGGRRQRDGR